MMLTHLHFGVFHVILTKKCSFLEEYEFIG